MTAAAASLDAQGALDAVARALPAELPAARCAAETAVLDLIGQRQAKPLWQLVRELLPSSEDAPRELPVAALLDDSEPERVLARAARARAAGFVAFKLKLGRRDQFALELSTVARLRAALGPVALRLDVNGAWTAAEARARLDALRALAPEFVEEPVRGAALPELGAVELPLALDESLLGVAPERLVSWLDSSPVRVLVLKPMLHGLGRCLELVRLASARDLDLVVSHLLDGPVALAAATALAFALPRSRLAHGLAAHPLLGAGSDALAPTLERSDAPGLGPAHARQP